jgi:hypothetical protein
LKEEGWYTDPFGLHEARWMSDGQPSALVRDGGVGSQDPPPSEPFAHDPQPVEEGTTEDPEDLLRADAAQTGESWDASNASEAALDSFGGIAGQTD